MKPSCRCDICGKFRKEQDVFLDEGESSDGFSVEQWLECKFCCSPADYDRYFKKEKDANEG